MNKIMGSVLAVLVGIIAGLCLLFSVTNVMHQNMLPMIQQLTTIDNNVRAIQAQLTSGGSNEQIITRLSAIEQRLASIEQKGAAAAPQAAPQMPPQEDFSKVYNIDISKSYVRGNKNAPVQIVEFTDFQCPFCGRFHGPLSETLKAYPKNVSYVIKNFPLPFHPNAMPAAKAALAAGEQGKYFEMADALMENQQDLSDAKYVELAKKIGLNVNQFQKDLKEKDAKFQAIISADMQQVNDVDVRGTPTFFINGKKTMARDAAGFKQEIDKILQEKGAK
jgi:protein-disulfide isomerase